MVIAAFLYRSLGRRLCLIIVSPAVLYFYATGREQRRASRDYLERLHRAGHWPRPPTALDKLRHFMSFATGMFDMFAAWSGNIPLSSIEGVHGGKFAAAKQSGQGAFILTAHLGSPEVIRAMANRLKRWRVNVLVHTRHAESFNRLIYKVSPDAPIRLIQVTDLGMDKLFLLQEAIENGEWVVSVADRIPVGPSARIYEVDCLGSQAPLPQGPLILATLLKCPIYTMFCLRQPSGYRVEFEKLADAVDLPRARRQEHIEQLMREYVARLEGEMIREPLQWYNFYDFWRPSQA